MPVDAARGSHRIASSSARVGCPSHPPRARAAAVPSGSAKRTTTISTRGKKTRIAERAGLTAILARVSKRWTKKRFTKPVRRASRQPSSFILFWLTHLSALFFVVCYCPKARNGKRLARKEGLTGHERDYTERGEQRHKSHNIVRILQLLETAERR